MTKITNSLILAYGLLVSEKEAIRTTKLAQIDAEERLGEILDLAQKGSYAQTVSEQLTTV